MAKLTEKERQSSRQYKKEVIPAIVLYMGMIFMSVYLLKDMKDTIWAYPLALSPLIPVYLIIRALVNFIKRTDELMRKLYGDSAVITLLIVVFAGFAYGLLINVGLPEPDIFLTASLISLLYFIIFAVLRRQQGMDGCAARDGDGDEDE